MRRLAPVGDHWAYERVIGAGGIGSGLLFLMDGNHTLGRNESRPAVLTPAKDFGKLHIILHYVAVLLGAGCRDGVAVYPVGCVGDDEVGRRVVREMRGTGMTVDHVRVSAEGATQFSVCFQYPDSAGGNITTSNSASDKLTPEDIRSAFAAFPTSGREITLAAPEVPMETRIELLRQGRQRGAFTVASVLASEAKAFLELGGPAFTDLLAVNIEEARALTELAHKDLPASAVAQRCGEVLSRNRVAGAVTVTDGPRGSYAYQGGQLEIVPPLPTDVVSSAGAGDAYVAGVITGLACGLPLLKLAHDRVFGETPLASALEFGTLVASYSLTTMDSIHLSTDADTLVEYAHARKLTWSDAFLRVAG